MVTDLPDATNTRAEQFAFLREQHRNGADWHNMCLALTRTAPGIPAGVPSAHAAMLMVPASDRITRVRDIRRGMAVFYDDPNDDNPFAHVDTACGWLTPAPTDDLHDLLTVSSDAPTSHLVGYVRGDWVPANWGDPFVFASTSLNGYDLPGYGKAANSDKAVAKMPHLHDTLDEAIKAVRQGIRAQRARNHPKRTAALLRDLHELQQTRKQFA